MTTKEDPSPPSSPTNRPLPPLTGFAHAFFNAKQSPSADTAPYQPPPFHKSLFFFYGTLTDPSTLKKVLHLSSPPILHPAHIIGYHVKLWGPYPALLDGPCGAKVEGLAFEVQSAEQVELLQEYETRRYRRASCRIFFREGGEESIGTTFVWKDDVGGEELREGWFDLKDFQMRKLEEGIAERKR